MNDCSVVDIFCGVGGLTHGFILEGFDVLAGIDTDGSCRYAFETNNEGARFIHAKIEGLSADAILSLYPEGHRKILVGCAPCQPYSSYNKKKGRRDGKWRLLAEFGNLICEVKPDLVSMENVPDLVDYNKGSIYRSFVGKLRQEGYYVSDYPELYCPDYGIPQQRTRLVMFASRFAEVDIIPPTHTPDQYQTARDKLGHMEPIEAGDVSGSDPLHRASRLSDLNLRRIRASSPGGTWRDWDEELIAACHRKASGDGYASVYGRMSWNEPSPTITTQFYEFGNGRFGHPEQDRVISLREGALLQTFPEYYQFVATDDRHYFRVIGRHIGNAVPVELGRVIARSIARHLRNHLG